MAGTFPTIRPAVVGLLAAGLMLEAQLLAGAKSGPPALTDAGISRAVETELQIDPIVSAHLIDVAATNGVITLAGSVDNLLSKERAVRLAKTIRGVRAVLDEMTVRPIERTDRQLSQAVHLALLRDPATDSYEIGVAVEDGVVTLNGTVQSWQERELAARVAKGIKGVKAVENGLNWKPVTHRRDAEIRRDIERRLQADVWLDHALIRTEVQQGDVTLTGTVGSARERSRAYEDAWVTGVRTVKASGLTVRDWAKDERKRSLAATPSDAEIEQAIALAFRYDPRVSAFNPEIKVAAGIVTLSGKVDNLKARQAAEQDARNTVGVVAVNNRLKVRPEVSFADTEIAEEVRQALAADPYLDSLEIGVSVVNRQVYLSGTVNSLFERSHAADLAARVNGVAEVRNVLSVNPGMASYHGWLSHNNLYWNAQIPLDQWSLNRAAVVGDATIKANIEDQLYWSPYVDSDDIQITVDEGTATLRGTVSSRMERGAAIDNAFQGGALSVRDELELEGHL